MKILGLYTYFATLLQIIVSLSTFIFYTVDMNALLLSIYKGVG